MPVKYGIPIAKNKRRNSKHIQKSNGERHCLEIMWESEIDLDFSSTKHINFNKLVSVMR
jgi:hypothetical protein